MKKIYPYFSYFIFWLLYFVLARGLFLLYHLNLTDDLSSGTVPKTILHGFRMDMSFAAYICILPFTLYFVKIIFPGFRVQKIIRVYSIILIFLISFLVTADLELYTAWGFRMDATPLQYFKNPAEMTATVSSAPVFMLLLIFAFLSFVSIFALRFFIIRMKPTPGRINFLYVPLGLFLIVVLFIPIRGGIQKIPMNISDAYFTDQLFANHAAINLPWNIMFSLLNKNSDENPYDFVDEKEAQQTVAGLYSHQNQTASILSTTRPNIIFIIMESFTAKLVGSLGGVPGVTPCLDSIASEGLLFSNFYASGDRSEKGQVAILSGYPNQAINSIIKIPTKTRNLPSLAKTLESYGYDCSYTYGGELEFANIKSYLLNTGYKKLTGKYDFPSELRTTSWGVHDEYVFNHCYSELKQFRQPFFATIFSLSSHEPFDVPLKHFKAEKPKLTDLFTNSVFYADSVLGDFIRKIKREPFWENTLVVIVADHGHPQPGDDANDVPSKFHIPLVFTGGALTTKGVVSTPGSQTDIATTVLDQLQIPDENFKWGRNLLDSSGQAFAFYNFNNGFGWVSSKGFVTVDNVSGRVIHHSPDYDTSWVRLGKAYMQFSYQDYLRR